MITEREMIRKFASSIKNMEDSRRICISRDNELTRQEALCRDAKSKFYEAQLEHEKVTREFEKYLLDQLSQSENG
jgi:hypothetical protein